MRPITAEETYRKLKHKVDYFEARNIYTMAAMTNSNGESRAEMDAAAESDLEEVGWTLEEFWDESALQEDLRQYESKYG